MTADTIGGVWTYALDLARAVHPLGVEVVLATMGDRPNASQRRDAARIPGLVVVESEYRLEWMDEPWDDVRRAGAWLLDLERRVAPDIVHLNGYAHGALPFSVPVLVVAHSCVLSWWQAVKRTAPPDSWGRYQSAVARGLAGADALIAPTRAMAAAIEQWYAPPADVRVVANGRDTSLYRAREKGAIVLTAGRLWDEAKNVALVAAAAEGLAWPVVVAGETAGPRGLEAVTCLGRLAPGALARWYGRAAVYALPARYEPFGLSALEAALSGCALVLGDIPSLREVWGDAALFVEPDDVQGLRDAVTSLMRNCERRRLFAARAAARARRYTIEHTARAYVSTYQQLGGRRLASAGGVHACAS